MNQINLRRLVLGGLAAGAIIWLIEGAASVLYMDDMQRSLAAHDLSMELVASTWVTTIVVSLLVGLCLIFFYAAARPRFGPGPRTALIVATAYWLGATLVSLLGYQMVGLYPGRMLVQWGVVGLAELYLAALVGGWIYREPAGSTV